MARPREFVEEDVVEVAMALFWSQGFEHTTLDDVVKTSRISKSSFYSAFASKHDLLARALYRYGETWMAGLLEPLSRPGAARREIEQAFETIAARFSGPLAAQGCLMTNCAIDVARHDPATRQHTKILRSAFEQAMRAAVVRGQDQGSISRGENANALAQFLVNALNGMSVLAKLSPEDGAMADIVRLSLRVLDDPHPQGGRTTDG